ncbi:MAG: phosphopantetheine-binding protein [Candidatus Saccharimonadaceae bacterium]|nr:phosphopantetheine-binding protein [Candidatus Saccharimonadaceae bacterium]
MKQKDIASLVIGIITFNFHLDDDCRTTVTPQTDLVEDLGADSLDLLNIALGIEDEFDLNGTDISDEEYINCRTVGNLINLVESKLS